MKPLYISICLFSGLVFAQVSAEWEEIETKLAYNIEFCRITASHFDDDELAQWEEIKTSYLDARRETLPNSESWTDLKKIMQHAQSAENNAKRRLENLAAKELYIHEACYEKRAKIQNDKPWLQKK